MVTFPDRHQGHLLPLGRLSRRTSIWFEATPAPAPTQKTGGPKAIRLRRPKTTLVVRPPPAVRIDAPIGLRVVHHVAFDRALALLVLEDEFLLVDPARRLADAGIALQIEVVGLLGAGMIIGHRKSPWMSPRNHQAQERATVPLSPITSGNPLPLQSLA